MPPAGGTAGSAVGYNAVIHNTPAPTNVPWSIGAISGSGVLLTAPHAVRHLRRAADGSPKSADAFTGPLVRTAATAAGCAALWVQGLWPGNANADPLETCPFKQQVLDVVQRGGIRAVLDVHGMVDATGPDVCIGTAGAAHGRELATVSTLCDDLGLAWSIDDPFDATYPGTVTSTVTRAGTPALQLELARRLRDPQRDVAVGLELVTRAAQLLVAPT